MNFAVFDTALVGAALGVFKNTRALIRSAQAIGDAPRMDTPLPWPQGARRTRLMSICQLRTSPLSNVMRTEVRDIHQTQGTPQDTILKEAQLVAR